MKVTSVGNTPRFLNSELIIHFRDRIRVVAVPGEVDSVFWGKALAPYGGNESIGLYDRRVRYPNLQGVPQGIAKVVRHHETYLVVACLRDRLAEIHVVGKIFAVQGPVVLTVMGLPVWRNLTDKDEGVFERDGVGPDPRWLRLGSAVVNTRILVVP